MIFIFSKKSYINSKQKKLNNFIATGYAMINSIEYIFTRKTEGCKNKNAIRNFIFSFINFFGEFISCLRQLINFRFCFYFTVRYETEILHKKNYSI